MAIMGEYASMTLANAHNAIGNRFQKVKHEVGKNIITGKPIDELGITLLQINGIMVIISRPSMKANEDPLIVSPITLYGILGPFARKIANVKKLVPGKTLRTSLRAGLL